jgi:hypothetical protein
MVANHNMAHNAAVAQTQAAAATTVKAAAKPRRGKGGAKGKRAVSPVEAAAAAAEKDNGKPPQQQQQQQKEPVEAAAAAVGEEEEAGRGGQVGPEEDQEEDQEDKDTGGKNKNKEEEEAAAAAWAAQWAQAAGVLASIDPMKHSPQCPTTAEWRKQLEVCVARVVGPSSKEGPERQRKALLQGFAFIVQRILDNPMVLKFRKVSDGKQYERGLKLINEKQVRDQRGFDDDDNRETLFPPPLHPSFIGFFFKISSFDMVHRDHFSSQPLVHHLSLVHPITTVTGAQASPGGAALALRRRNDRALRGHGLHLRTRHARSQQQQQQQQ